MAPEQQLVTQLLRQWQEGNKEALDQLMPLVYDQLRKLASRCLYAERQEHTLRATALVNEAYLRLVDSNAAFNDRVHFYAVAAKMLRHILVDHAKAQNRQKRGGGAEKLPIEEAILVGPTPTPGIVELDDALNLLALNDKRKSEIVEMVFFGGLTYEEVAAALDISAATVHRELKMAKAWLHRELAST
jgi:RNA polymerase sigma factor (TIGR02999 family)